MVQRWDSFSVRMRELVSPLSRHWMRDMAKRLKLNQAAARGIRHGFGAADDVHLREDGFHVRLHGAFTDKESRADLFVAFAASHQLEDFDLARAQRFAADALASLAARCTGTQVSPACTRRMLSINA